MNTLRGEYFENLSGNIFYRNRFSLLLYIYILSLYLRRKRLKMFFVFFFLYSTGSLEDKNFLRFLQEN